MPRARNIKPAFFKNEDLADLPFGVRLLFIGLWTLADRDGRLEDRPKRIQMELFPADSVDTDDWLWALHERGFILRYEACGVRCIQIPAFIKHQNPHHREGPSTLPAPGEDQSQPEAIPSPALGKPTESPAESPLLNPDSLQGTCARSAPESVDKPRKRFEPPTISEVAAYCGERNNGIDAEHFVAHYTAKGWRIGKSPMKDWRATIITWEKRNAADRKTGNRNGSHATLSRIAAEDDPEELGSAPVSEVHDGIRPAVDGEYRRH